MKDRTVRYSRFVQWCLRVFLFSLVIVWGTHGFAEGDRARIHKEFPIKKPGQLSPPIVQKPIHPCAESVFVSGFIPGAMVEVIANGAEVVGTTVTYFGYVTMPLSRPLKLGEKITATQTVGGKTSSQSVLPVIVTPYPDTLTQPEVNKDLYDCGRVVPVGNLVESAKVQVYADGVLIGEASPSGTWVPVVTQPLKVGQKVVAIQIACDKKGPESEPVIVKPMPTPVPAPEIDSSQLIIGNNAVLAHNLLVGSALDVFNGPAWIGGGLTTGSSNWCPVNPPLAGGSSITATQKLCDVSTPSEPETPVNTLNAPVLVGPVCKGSQFILVRNSTVNANVIVYRNGAIAGYGGAMAGDLWLSLSQPLAVGDVINVRQTMGNTASPLSNSVTVSSSAVPVVEVLGGEPFFLPEAGETAIDGPVFARFKGDGPLVRIQSCCAKKVSIQVNDFNEKTVKELTAVEVFPGYFEVRWKWADGPWAKPGDVPVGRYSVKVTTDCYEKPVVKPLYIIFDPKEVDGPDRFSFNETGIWFGTGYNKTNSLTYQLHPDDQRIFSRALKAAQGETDAYKAAQKVAAAEEALFSYSLSYHSNDTIDLLLNYTEAQCADDANMLAAMLRAVGIPAHPATADAALETGNANWTFDTWTEFLVLFQGKPEWLVVHPHEFPGMSPETRSVFGSTRGVASKQSDDIIVMAGENWDPNQIPGTAAQFKRNSCGEPEQVLSFKQPWLVELCENGYWVNHWACANSGGSGFSFSHSLRFDHARRVLSGTITAVELDKNWLGQKVTIELVSDLPESKLFPDKVLGKVQVTLPKVVKSGVRPVAVPISIKFDKALPPGQDLYLRVTPATMAVVPHDIKSVRSFRLIPVEPNQDVSAILDIKKMNRVGDTIAVSGVVANTSNRVVKDIRATLTVPPGFRIKKAKSLTIPELKAGEKKSLVWTVLVVSPVETGLARLSVNTSNGGWFDSSGIVRALAPRQSMEIPGTVLIKK